MLWFKSPDGLKPNLLLFAYLLLAWPAALYGMSLPAWFLPALLLMANVLVLSAYLLHECLHNNIFAAPANNDRLGWLLAWLVGAVYSPYAILREKHYRHHIERADILAVDYRAVLARHPVLDRAVRWATYLHVPAVELLLQWLDVLAPLYLPARRHLLGRTLCILAVRLGLFCALALYSPLAAAGYLGAYVICLWVLGFMDAFQHSYDVRYRLQAPQQKPLEGRDYEERNTYTNLLSSRFPWLNLLVLNFCYHNAHHHKPSEPWYRLPALHQRRYADGCPQRVPLSEQLARYHRHRLTRIHHPDAGRQTGADGVSFLVGV